MRRGATMSTLSLVAPPAQSGSLPSDRSPAPGALAPLVPAVPAILPPRRCRRPPARRCMSPRSHRPRHRPCPSSPPRRCPVCDRTSHDAAATIPRLARTDAYLPNVATQPTYAGASPHPPRTPKRSLGIVDRGHTDACFRPAARPSALHAPPLRPAALIAAMPVTQLAVPTSATPCPVGQRTLQSGRCRAGATFAYESVCETLRAPTERFGRGPMAAYACGV
ncbi:uncharacterized protein C8Q71DRAFT_121489 [Rhodofomes roseus]|uniref:Uncharacterized protein n=1 Tax=Rhodofomes roseus TaxID=34475 RepID=A0ABQ8KBC1_9APHY|nr:uncharacterized protein C8Q71DRAFT_121489 [Rhodofomes roseus]KAH9834733.1 hypothetical protein C8Q71DRAFT_121489 [Rhodofomes roseus]